MAVESCDACNTKHSVAAHVQGHSKAAQKHQIKMVHFMAAHIERTCLFNLSLGTLLFLTPILPPPPSLKVKAVPMETRWFHVLQAWPSPCDPEQIGCSRCQLGGRVRWRLPMLLVLKSLLCICTMCVQGLPSLPTGDITGILLEGISQEFSRLGSPLGP